MGKLTKIFEHIMTRRSDAGVVFSDLRLLLLRTGFMERVRGDHYIYTMKGVEEIINVQPKGALAKAYQVKQVRELFSKYKLMPGEE